MAKLTNSEKLFWWCSDVWQHDNTCVLYGLDDGNPVTIKATIDDVRFNHETGAVTVVYLPVEK